MEFFETTGIFDVEVVERIQLPVIERRGQLEFTVSGSMFNSQYWTDNERRTIFRE